MTRATFPFRYLNVYRLISSVCCTQLIARKIGGPGRCNGRASESADVRNGENMKVVIAALAMTIGAFVTGIGTANAECQTTCTDNGDAGTQCYTACGYN